ncbi:MAG TPA: hypothetical protein VM286_07390 [Candidatus Thermoplasmatota archaeon]|nr:hypothetical protein [Candidatus Thermoplasmatota archaeon]
MHRATLFMVLLLAVSLGAAMPQASAQGSRDRTVLLASDPAGDQAIVPPTVPNPAFPPPAYTNVDLTALLARQPADSAATYVDLVLNFSAAPTAGEVLQVAFNLAKGPESLSTSTATGAAKSLTITGTTVSGAEGATATGTGKQLALRIPYSGIGASPGDVLQDLVVTASDRDGGPSGDGPVPDQVTADDSSASDRAPNAGGAAAFTLQPPPFRSDLVATVTGGEVRQANGTRPFAGARVTTTDGSATVRFDILVTNRARAADTIHVSAPGASIGVQYTVPAPATLAPGGSATLAVTVRLQDVPPGTLAPDLEVSGSQGSIHTTATIVVQPAPAGHHAVPAALAFLTPLATGLGLDGPLGNYAELGLLLLFVLLGVVLLFLALFLVQTPWLRVAVEPRRATAELGGVAEFRIRLDKARRGVAAAKAVLRSSPWGAAFRFRGAPVPEGQAYDVRIDPANPAEGTLRVEVPADASNLDRQTVEFDIVPMDAQGVEMPRHRARGHVTVQPVQPASRDPKVPKARDIQLASVRHEPPDPLPGGTVTTTATIRNDGGGPAALRIVLMVDAHPVLEERVEVAARSTREVALPWTAGAGKNQVKVQVFLA